MDTLPVTEARMQAEIEALRGDRLGQPAQQVQQQCGQRQQHRQAQRALLCAALVQGEQVRCEAGQVK